MNRRTFIRLFSALPLMLAGTRYSYATPKWEGSPLDAMWSAYKHRFIQLDGRVVEHSSQSRTTSEGQAYALFHSLVYDDRKTFDRVLAWTRDNLCDGDMSSQLPAWLWGQRPDGKWHVLNDNNAADADLWIAYCLRHAAYRWQHDAYEKTAKAIASRIIQTIVVDLPGLGKVLLPGARGFTSEEGWQLNPSYIQLPIFVDFAKAWPNQGWDHVNAGSRALLEHCRGKAGYAPDWVRWTVDGRCEDEPVHGDVGSYDAIRLYLWLAVTPDALSTLHLYHGMTDWLQSHRIPPERVHVHSGLTEGNAPIGFSAALLPYLLASGNHTAYQTQRARVLQFIQSDPGLEYTRYYDANLILFGLGAVSGRYRFNNDGRLLVRVED